MTALDFVSLLLSKDQPNLSGSTLSPYLREAVGTGTLGADKIAASKVTQAQVEDDRVIAREWKARNLSKSVDSILASASRLEKEIEVETKYWGQVLAISEKGWAICRLPQERQTLGVRIGFLEAAPAFRNNSLAALRREADGNIILDQGMASTEPQTLRVRIRSTLDANEELGTSPIPAPIPDDAPIEARILQARNTTFFSELWQELNREARTLASFSVRSKEDTITCPLSPTKLLVLDLVPLSSTSIPSGRPDDAVALGISLCLSILLTYQHRQNHRRRTQPPPVISTQKRAIPPYNLLRPIITRLDHQRTVTAIHTLLKPLCAVLSSAQLHPAPNYTIASSPTQYPSTSLSPTESTILSMIDRLESITILSLLPNATLKIVSRTAMFPVAGTVFILSLQPEDCPLHQICRPPSSLDAWWKVEDYILFAVGCALASSFTPNLTFPSTPPKEHQDEETNAWQQAVQPYILRRRVPGTGRSKQLAFQVLKSTSLRGQSQIKEHALRLKVHWEWLGDPWAKDKRRNKLEGGEGSYEWVEKMDRSPKVTPNWNDGEGEVVRSLGDVVEEAGRA